MISQLHQASKQLNQIIIGKESQIQQALVCLLAGGHLLIEDVPGVGKTTLAHALAIALGLSLIDFNLLATYFRLMLQAGQFLSAIKINSSFTRALSLRKCYSPMKLIVRHLKHSLLY